MTTATIVIASGEIGKRIEVVMMMPIVQEMPCRPENVCFLDHSTLIVSTFNNVHLYEHLDRSEGYHETKRLQISANDKHSYSLYGPKLIDGMNNIFLMSDKNRINLFDRRDFRRKQRTIAQVVSTVKSYYKSNINQYLYEYSASGHYSDDFELS